MTSSDNQPRRKLWPLSHKPKELAFRLEHTLKSLSHDKKALARTTLGKLYDDVLPSVDLENPDLLQCLLQTYMAIFDGALFSGSLGHHIKLFVCPLEENVCGMTSSSLLPGGVYTEICIWPIVLPQGASRNDKELRLGGRLCTLLHEMLHAYFQIYNGHSETPEIELLGATGHGWCWQYAAREIEVFMYKELSMNVRLGRATAWVQELAYYKPDEIEVFKQRFKTELMYESRLDK
ncbi:hypothetical protein N431DRAFT_470356 [Stipitochalara longipes BDJ]|nr:hypothetical protein N431DRAFT_470356 [Stipitochalara longipes BDJ]